MFNGKIHYKMAIFNSFLYVYQRVTEEIIQLYYTVKI